MLELGVVGDHRAAFAHGDVVRRVEALGAEMAEGTGVLPVSLRAQGVAVILDEPQVVPAGKRRHLLQIKGNAQGVGEENGPCLLRNRRLQLR